MSEPTLTLLDDLEALVNDHSRKCCDCDEITVTSFSRCLRIERLRAAATRLRRKVAMAESIEEALRAREYVSPNDVARLELTREINNGPLAGTAPSEAPRCGQPMNEHWTPCQKPKGHAGDCPAPTEAPRCEACGGSGENIDVPAATLPCPACNPKDRP